MPPAAISTMSGFALISAQSSGSEFTSKGKPTSIFLDGQVRRQMRPGRRADRTRRNEPSAPFGAIARNWAVAQNLPDRPVAVPYIRRRVYVTSWYEARADQLFYKIRMP
jgi:hypothetical protein